MKKTIFTVALALVLSLFANAQLKVWTGGKVAVGTTSTTPGTLMELQASTPALGYYTSHNAYNAVGAKIITDATSSAWNASYLSFQTHANNTSAFTDDLVVKAGKVGIGTVSPSTKLEITGGSTGPLYATYSPTGNYGYAVNINVSGLYVNLTKVFAAQNSGSDKFVVWGNGDVWSYTNYYSSDSNLKENIDTLKGALTKVLQLQGYTYNFKPSVVGDPNPKKQIGLLAQDVETVLPEVVATNDMGLKGVAYQNIVALLIEAMKEQDKKMSKMQSDLDNCCTKSNQRMINPGTENQDGTTGKLFQNIPNPFNQATTIKYFIPAQSNSAYLMVFDMNGSLKKTFPVNQKGENTIIINARELSAGMYYYTRPLAKLNFDIFKVVNSCNQIHS